MRIIQKTVLLGLVALVFAVPLAGMYQPEKAYAASDTDMTLEDQVDAYLYSTAFYRCITQGAFKAPEKGLTLDNIQDYKIGSDKTVSLGVLLASSDGKTNCNKSGDNSWIGKAFDLWGYDDPLEALCAFGWHKKDKPNQSAADCVKSSGPWRGPVDQKGTKFRTALSQKLNGKASKSELPVSGAMAYFLYSQTFLSNNGCGGNAKPLGLYSDLSTSDKNQVDNAGKNSNYFKMKVYDPDTQTMVYKAFKATHDNDNAVIVRGKDGDDKEDKECRNIVKEADKNADAFLAYAKANPDDTGALGAASAVNSEDADLDEISCGKEGGVVDVLFSNPINWLACPMASLFNKTAGALDNSINSMLCIDETQFFGDDAINNGNGSGGGTVCGGNSAGSDNSAGYKDAWAVFRTLGLGFVAIAGLVMVISQAVGLEIFDAYAVRKTLPRLLVAAIFIVLSWQLLAFFVNLSNVLGIGIRGLIYAPFVNNLDGDPGTILSGGSAAINLLIGAGGFLALGGIGILSFIGTGLLAVLIAFFVVIIRSILVQLLIIMAPIAIAMYVLPNTEKYWKLWWESLSKALMMFPFITAFIAVSHVFGAIASKQEGTISSYVAFISYFAPYFLLPLAFKFAGGALGTIGGFVNDRSRGGFDRLRNFRKGQTEQRMGHYGQVVGDRAMQARAEAIRGLNASASNGGRGAGLKRFAGRQIGGLGNFEAKMSAINARTGKAINDQIATGDDSEIRALTVNRAAADNAGSLFGEDGKTRLPNGNGYKRLTEDGKIQYKTLGGGWVDDAAVANGQARWGRDVAAQQAAVSYEMRKALTNEDVAGISERYGSLAKQQFGMTDTQAAGAWIGAGFENQNQHLEFKNTDWKTGGLQVEKFAKEAYEKKGSYQLSQMSGHTIKQLTNSTHQTISEIASTRAALDTARAAGNTDEVAKQQTILTEKEATMGRLKAVSETFMQQMGSSSGQMDANGELIPPNPAAAGANGIRRVGSNGAGAVGEEVYRFAHATGVIDSPPNAPQSPGSPQTNT